MKLMMGTRGSALAVAQSGDVARMLEAQGHEVEVTIIETKGDMDRDRPFAEVGAPGLFVREIEYALLDGRIDFAVHSYKDLPSDNPDGLIIAAIPERVDAADHLLVAAAAWDPDAGPLPVKQGAIIGTASARRQALLSHLRPDLSSKLLRGNVPTRIQKLADGDYDAILLAGAGIHRLARSGIETLKDQGIQVARLDPAIFIPAPSQGALAVQVRRNDAPIRAAIEAINDASATPAVQAERRLQALVEGGCRLPFGAYATPTPSGGLMLRAFLAVEGQAHQGSAQGTDPHAVAERLWDQLNQWEGPPPWQAKTP